jgi:hypothetical protein
MTIERGDYVRFAHLPSAMQPTPILVTDVTATGMVQLEGRGWFEARMLAKIELGPEDGRGAGGQSRWREKRGCRGWAQ